MRTGIPAAAVAALMLSAVAALECGFSFPDCQAPRVVEMWKRFREHNGTLAQFAVATSDRDGWSINITDAQLDAVIAADEAPDEQRDTPEDEGLSWDYDEEKRHIDHIYKTLNAGFSLSDIHILFHNSDGLPIRLSDASIDAAMAERAANAVRTVKRDFETDCERHFPNCGSPRFIKINKLFRENNVSSAQRHAAMQTEDPQVPTELSDAQVDAIVAADESSFDQDAADRKGSSDQDADGEDNTPYDFQQDVRHIKHIYRALNASFSLSEIHKLFHNKDGLPIMLSDQEVDAAIVAHAANAARTVKRDGIVDCEAHFPNCDSPRSIKISETFMAHNLTVYQRLAAFMTELDANSDTDLTDAQVDAIVSAEQAPFNQEIEEEYGVTHDLVNEKRQLVQIYKVLGAKLSSAEIYNLFHSKDGLPIMLSDEKVDAAIAAHNALSVPQVART